MIPYSKQSINDSDIAAVCDALRAEFLTTGPLVEIYERDFAVAVGADFAIACNSGTAALHLAVLALGIGPGDSVVVPSITFLATANVIRMTGAEVVFADVDPDTGLITQDTLASAISRESGSRNQIRGCIVVHLNGQICDMPGLAAEAACHGIWLVEDACHALGAPCCGANLHSAIACFSSHPVKAIATGEGGMATTSDSHLAQRMALLRNHGLSRDHSTFVNRALAFDEHVPNPWYYEMVEIGWNYRLPDVLCALGISQLRRLRALHERRVDIAVLYESRLRNRCAHLQPVREPEPEHGWHLYPVLIAFDGLGLSRRVVMERLREQGVGTQVHYIPVHHQPYYRKRYGALGLRGADRYYERCMSIPLFPDMTDEDAERVVAALLDVLGTT